METIIEAKNLSKIFEGTKAVNGISFSVKGGEIFAFLGPDGAGKTTIMRMLSGLMSPSSGELSVLGMEMPREAEQVKERIGYMSQKFNLYPDLTVDENIFFFAGIYGIDRSALEGRLKKLFEITRLEKFRKRFASKLSGGMKQKLALICTLIHRPEILILDEPTTGVDPVSRREFWEVLQGIVFEGVTVVLSTPYLDEAEWSNRVCLMYGGQIVLCDTPQNMRGGSKSIVFDVFGAEGKGICGLLKNIPGVTDVHLFGKRCHVIVENEGFTEGFLKALEGRAEARRVVSSIEDIFVEKIRENPGRKNG